MENIFTLPRSGESHPDNKNLVGSYILQKFIRQGLMTAEQTFHHEIKLNALARMKRLPRVVMFSTLLLIDQKKSKNQITYVRSFELSFCVNAVIYSNSKAIGSKRFPYPELRRCYFKARSGMMAMWYFRSSKVTSDSRIRSSTINDC